MATNWADSRPHRPHIPTETGRLAESANNYKPHEETGAEPGTCHLCDKSAARAQQQKPIRRLDERRSVSYIITARSRTVLPEPGPAARNRRRLRLTFDPISLAWGEYTITLALTRPRVDRPHRWGELIDRMTLGRRLKITTPLPYDFRLAAQVPAQWEDGA